ncbi:MAG: hypothetical protein EA404_12015 [Spirochaetaceae bacterium]|nr:MAG: hypothetical protein EA404_12015 [Spirochaetaceae bacterium]
MDAVQREYERFGPWVAPIEGVQDIPQQFLRYQELIAEAVFAFKIPINVERRNVKQGMPLYHTVVVFSEDELLLLQRIGKDVHATEILYKDIQYLQRVGNVLVGEILLGTAEQIHVLNFNPVEVEPVEKGIGIIRKSYLQAGTSLNLDAIEESPENGSLFYENLIAQHFRGDDLRVVEYQPPVGLKKNPGKALDPNLPAQEPLLEDSLFLTNGTELITMNRKKETRLPEEADYGYRYTFVPVHTILDVTLEPDDSNDVLRNLSFILKETKVVLLVGPGFSVQRLKAILNI